MSKEEVVEETGIKEAFLEIKDLISVLKPAKSINISDVYGNEYGLRLFISAENQIELVRIFESISEEAIKKDIDIKSVKRVVAAVLKLALDPDVAKSLGEAFALAHPKVFKAAVKASKDEGDNFKRMTQLFSLQDIVGGVMPFLFDAVNKMMAMFQAE